jgi:hypothetical protein
VPVCPAMRACACARPGCCRPRRYPSDATDAEWALTAPLLPVPAHQTKAGGRRENFAVPTEFVCRASAYTRPESKMSGFSAGTGSAA